MNVQSARSAAAALVASAILSRASPLALAATPASGTSAEGPAIAMEVRPDRADKWTRVCSFRTPMCFHAEPGTPHRFQLAAVAAGGALPWDAPLTTLQNDLQGPVAHAITTAAIIGTGIMWSVSEHGTGVRKMSSLAFGGSCALGATQLMTTLFPLGGALF